MNLFPAKKRLACKKLISHSHKSVYQGNIIEYGLIFQYTISLRFTNIPAYFPQIIIFQLVLISQSIPEPGLEPGPVAVSWFWSSPGSVPGHELGPVTGSVPGSVPGPVPGSVPGSVPGYVPSYVLGSVPGSVPVPVSGPVPGLVPGPLPLPVPVLL